MAAPVDAIEALREACARSPGRPELLVRLARALLEARRAVEAVVPAEQAVALAPGLVSAIKLRDAVLAEVQEGDPDLVKLELTAALDPTSGEKQLALGEAYANLDRPHDAERCYKRALALGQARDAHALLAMLYLKMSMFDAAEHHAGAALAGPDRGEADDLIVAMAHQIMAAVLEARGEVDAAARRLDEAYRRRSWFRQKGASAPFTTLVLVTRTSGNLPFRNLLPPLRSDVVLWYMEHARASQFAELQAHAVVLNAIGDPDQAIQSEAIVDAFVAQSDRPVLNRPEKVRATFRHRLPQTLAGIENLLVPITVRIVASEIVSIGLAAAAAKAGVAAPLLVRPVASHGGAGLALAPDAAELAAITPPVGDTYLTGFHDYRSADGFYRKYRMIFVDRQPFAYHLAISRNWMVHHQSSEMAGDAARMGEELEFLCDPTAVLGPQAMAAITAIGRRLDLDYGGVDFGLTADGRVLVFEANATMLTHLELEDSPFVAKNAFIQPIIEAFQAHLAQMARTGRSA